MRTGLGVGVAAVLLAASLAQAALTNLGDFNISGLPPATNSYTGGGIAFIPANTDSVGVNTLVINWREKDTVDTTKYNQVFQRITIPATGGTPTVLATATIRWDMLYDGTNQFGSNGAADLVFDAPSNRLVTVRGPQDGGNRFFWFDLFASNVTYGAGQVGYSAKNGDNTTVMNKVIIPSAGGVFTSFYPFSTNWVKASMDIDSGNGAAITKTSIAKTSFTGWWPDTSAYPYTASGFDSEGGAAYGSDVLLLRNYTNGTILESHLYQVNNALDAAAINGFTDLGNMTPTGATYASLTAYGMTVNGSTAYVRYGFTNNTGAYNRILMVSVPEPATLALVVFGTCGLLLRRRG